MSEYFIFSSRTLLLSPGGMMIEKEELPPFRSCFARGPGSRRRYWSALSLIESAGYGSMVRSVYALSAA